MHNENYNKPSQCYVTFITYPYAKTQLPIKEFFSRSQQWQFPLQQIRINSSSEASPSSFETEQWLGYFSFHSSLQFRIWSPLKCIM